MALDTQEIRLLYAQLHKREGLTIPLLSKKTGIPSNALREILHSNGGQNSTLTIDEHNRLVSFMKVQMERLGKTSNPLLLDQAALRKLGYGNRIGSVNRVEPFVEEVSDYIAKLHDENGMGWQEIAAKIGVPGGVVADLGKHKSKHIFARNRVKIGKWYEREQARAAARNVVEPGAEPVAEVSDEDFRTALHEGLTGETDLDELLRNAIHIQKPGITLDAEIAAIEALMNALFPLDETARRRVLSYVEDRLGVKGRTMRSLVEAG